MNSLLKKTLTMILVSVVLSAVITVLVFHVTGTRAYARIKLDELQPRAAFLADRTGLYMQGFVNREEYAAMIDSDRRVWDAQVYVYNADGLLIIHSMGGNTERDMQLAQRHLAQVLDGETIGAFTMQNGSGAIAGAPITSVYGNIIGAVFLVKPLQELNATLASLIWALVIAMLLSMVIMILPSYFTSLRLTGPLKTMNEAALAMAKGNFSIRAHEKGKDEVAQLGRSLNDLSGSLSSTIGALTFERNRLKSVLDGLVFPEPFVEGQHLIRTAFDVETADLKLHPHGPGRAADAGHLGVWRWWEVQRQQPARYQQRQQQGKGVRQNVIC